MSRGNYSAGKRLREAKRARQKQDKRERLRRNREERPDTIDGIPIASAAEIQPLAATDEASISAAEISPSGVAPRPMRAARQRSTRLFVGGLSWDTQEEGLRQAFSEFGEITDAVVIFDRQTGRSRGFGFVTYADGDAAAKALEEMDGAELDSRRLKVTLADKQRR